MKKKFNQYKKTIKAVFIAIIILAGVNSFLISHNTEKVSYNEFLKLVESNEVESIELTGKETFSFKLKDDEKTFYKRLVTDHPKSEDFKETMLIKDVKVEVKDNQILLTIIRSLPTLFLIFVLLRTSSSLIKPVSKLVSEIPDINFSSIAGNHEPKEDLKFLVNFLKEPKLYHDIGAKLPKGVVLYGPPGTGKTLTAKAIAGEAGVPFYSVSGSDFVEMYVGLGAKRVRDLFKSAKENSPCIIFIDEIDAVGTKRGKDNNSEKDQTINALLSELDGFSSDDSIVTMIATNRVEDLDPALIRPGRFDKHIAIGLPNKQDRLDILNVYVKGKKIDEDVDLEELSKLTIGFSGAALETVMNEAAIIAVNEGQTTIKANHVEEAYFKTIVKGHEKKERHNKDDLLLTAYHEAGHALVSKLISNQDIPKVTVIPSTSGYGGATFRLPEERLALSKEELLNNIKVSYGGRAAEEIFFGNRLQVTTGASNDIAVATQSIKDIFEKYGMSNKFGMFAVQDEKVYLDEALKLSEELYIDTLTLLKENKILLDAIAEELIKKETLTGEELDKIIKEGKKREIKIIFQC